MPGLGRKTFIATEVLTAANVNGYLMDQSVMKFASSAARSSAIGTAVSEGMVSYLADTDALEVYNGSSWGAVSSSSSGNVIINGAMDIAQRGTASVTPTTNLTYTLDRWVTQLTAASKFSVQQNAGSVTPPSGFAAYLGVTSLSSYSVASGDTFAISQRIEGYNSAQFLWGTASAKTVTLSFYVYSSLTGTHSGSLTNESENRSYPFTFTVSSANTWTLVSVVIPGDTSGTWGTAQGSGIKVFFNLGVGSTYAGTAGAWTGSGKYGASGAVSVVGTNAATFYLTGVQLEAGSVATPFKRNAPSIQAELAACQRYYVRWTAAGNGYYIGGFGNAPDASKAYLHFRPSVSMRGAPSSVDYSASNRVYDETNLTTATSITLVTVGNQDDLIANVTTGSGLTAFRAYNLVGPAASIGYIGFSAEL